MRKRIKYATSLSQTCAMYRSETKIPIKDCTTTGVQGNHVIPKYLRSNVSLSLMYRSDTRNIKDYTTPGSQAIQVICKYIRSYLSLSSIYRSDTRNVKDHNATGSQENLVIPKDLFSDLASSLFL